MKKILIITLMALSSSSFCQNDLDQYLLEGANNNPGLKSKFSMYMASLEMINTVGLPDPQVAFVYFIQPVETRLGPQQFKFSASQMFPWFGKLDAQRSVYAEKAKINYEEFLQTKSELYYKIRMSYYNLYFLHKARIITEENLQILETLKRLAIVKYESGKSSIVDEMRVEMEINDLNDQLLDLEDNIHLLKVKFNTLLNKEEEEEIALPDSLNMLELPDNYEAIKDSILSNNHHVKMLENKLSTHEAHEVLARKQDGPSVMLGIDYIMIGKSNNPMVDPALDGQDAIVFPKVSLSIPIYRSKYNAMVQKVNYEIEATSAGIEDKKNILTILFETGMRDYRDAIRRYELYQKQEVLARTSLNILITEYSTSDKNFEEVLRMERKLLSYQLAKDKAISDANAAVAFIQYLMGN